MTAGHGSPAVRVADVAARDTVVHRLDARAKIVGLIGLAVVSATTPTGRWWAFVTYLSLLAGLMLLARLPVPYVTRRLLIEVPFLVAAGVLVFTAPEGPEVGITVAAKATIGLLAMILLSSTTPFPVLLRGFEALRAPRTIVLIVAMLWRYLQVFGDELQRMRVAREARGYRPRWLWQSGALASTIATLFVRGYERGERVHLAMVARGYGGGVPATLWAPLAFRHADVAFLGSLALALILTRAVLP